MGTDAQAGERLRAHRREAVLAQCVEATAAWKAAPGRNLVLMFDGTGNILGNSRDTNVVKLLRRIRKQAPYALTAEQVVYYDPGVGTANEFPPAGFGARYKGYLQQFEGLAGGRGAFENVAEAYEFLCREHRPGDRIWLFGFSRGAFTARAVGGMVNMYGLVHATGLPLVQSLVRTYFAEGSRGRDAFAADVIAHFAMGRTPLIHFTGVWDTVESIGLLGGVRITNSTRFEHKRFVHVRHALAVHETRQKYRPRPYTAPEFTPAEEDVRSFDQRWFRGVHSDVGGSYAEDGLSNIALNWMIDEARRCGLDLDGDPFPEDPRQFLHDQALESPYWVLGGLDARDRCTVQADVHGTAKPIEAAQPARRSPGAWLARTLGVGFFVLMGVFCAFAIDADRMACTWNGGANRLAALPTSWQLLAPWAERLGIACGQRAVAQAIAWDFAFLAFYWLWLAYPLAWALRRWCALAIVENRTLPGFAARVHLALWSLLAADVFENLCTLHLPLTAWLVTLSWLVKMASLGWVLAVIAGGALRGTRPVRQCDAVRAPPEPERAARSAPGT